MSVITKEITNGNIETKRFYLPAEITVACPKCGVRYTDDFDDSYLSYPEVGKNIDRHCYCHECDTEFKYPVKLTLTLTADTSEVSLYDNT